MSIEMDEEVKRCTARMESALVLEINQSGDHSREDHRKRVVPTVRSASFRDRVLDSPS
jgi:hypothetical protein